ILVLACLLVGIAPAISIGPFLAEAVIAVLGEQTPHYILAPWHGYELTLVMSFLALAGGIAFYIILRRFFNLADRVDAPVLGRLSGASAFEIMMLYISSISSRLLKFLGTVRLQPQLLVMLLLMVLGPLLLVRPFLGDV